MFLTDLRAELSQGDILDGIIEPFADPNAERFLAMLLTNDCDIDKPKQYPCLLTVRVVPLSRIDASLRGDIERRRTPKAMWLGGHVRIDGHFADFRHVHRVPRDAVINASVAGNRIASMTDAGRLAVAGYLFANLIRKQEARQPGQQRAPVVTIPDFTEVQAAMEAAAQLAQRGTA